MKQRPLRGKQIRKLDGRFGSSADDQVLATTFRNQSDGDFHTSRALFRSAVLTHSSLRPSVARPGANHTCLGPS
jgi:hypothetical protein